MERHAFLIGKKHGKDIDWQDSNRLVRMIEEHSLGGFIEHEESRRTKIDKKDDNVPYRLLLIAVINKRDYESFKKEVYDRGYEIIEEKRLGKLEVIK